MVVYFLIIRKNIREYNICLYNLTNVVTNLINFLTNLIDISNFKQINKNMF